MEPPRRAACSCGQLQIECAGEPVRISLCHCLACQRRTGSAFGVQARFPGERVRASGEAATYERRGDAGSTARFRFCPRCGATVYWTTRPAGQAPGEVGEAVPGEAASAPPGAAPGRGGEPRAQVAELVAVAIGAFADPTFPPPKVSVYEERQHAFVQLVGEMEHLA